MNTLLNVEYPYANPPRRLFIIHTEVDVQLEQALKKDWISAGYGLGKRDIQFEYPDVKTATEAKEALERVAAGWPVKITANVVPTKE